MKVENVPEFHRRFEAYVETHILPEQTSAILNIDAQIVGHIEEGPRSLTIKSEFGEFNY